MGRAAVLIGMLCAGLLGFARTSKATNSDWLCTEQASVRQGDAVLACGVGTGADENQARLNAFDNSKAEFTRVCGLSTDCKDHEITVEPKRTTCEQEKSGYKCYRLIVFHINPAKSQPQAATARPAQSLQSASGGGERADDFRPFVYSESKAQPKIRIGMKKEELLATFGAPWQLHEPGWHGGVDYVYTNRLCAGWVEPVLINGHPYSGGSVSVCSVTVGGGWFAGGAEVTHYEGVNPIYADLLK